MNKRESEAIIEKYLEEDITLFSDLIFNKVASNIDFVEELLQVIFNDKKLKVLKCETQKTYKILKQRGIRLDCLCELFDGKKVSVEIEKNDFGEKWDSQRRVRYYGSIIDVMSLKQKQIYDELPELYMVYLTTKDIFGKGKIVYHVERYLEECKEKVDNGYHEIYVNAENDDKSELAEVMKIMSIKDYVNPKFKTISREKEEKLMPTEVREAFDVIMTSERAEGRAEGKAEGITLGRIKAIIELLKKGLISEDVALSSLGLSKEELDRKIEELKI